MDSPCAGCQARCCVGRAVTLVAADVRRLQRALGVPWGEFAAVISDDDGFALVAGGPRYAFRLRARGDGTCVFAIDFSRERRCGVHEARPLACRVYPFHVALGAARPLATIGNDAACPPAHAIAWSEQLDAEWPSLDAAIAAAGRDSDARARWHAHLGATGRRYLVDDYLAWTAERGEA
jgi:Fe-S-cluster containining protein